MKVINLFAGPGVGKSTTAAGLFNVMKLLGMNVELVTEFAKDLTWEGRTNTLSNQLYILAKQEARLARLDGKVDFVVTDSPLLLGLLYLNPRYDTKWFRDAVFGAYDLYDNHEFRLRRVKPYSPIGRNQSEAEARRIDEALDRFLEANYDYPITEVDGDENAPLTIFKHLFGGLPSDFQ